MLFYCWTYTEHFILYYYPLLFILSFCLSSILAQPRCWETLGWWTSSCSCLLMWSPGCELSSVGSWTSCSSYLSCSPVIQWPTHMGCVTQLRQVLKVKPTLWLCLESLIYKLLNVHNFIMERGGEGGVDSLFYCADILDQMLQFSLLF